MINQDTTVVLKEKVSRSDLSLAIDSLRESIESFGGVLLRDEDKLKAVLAVFNRTSYYLYSSLLAPTQKFLTKNVTIIPDGIIYNVPFSCLTSKAHDLASWTAESFFIYDHNLTFNYSLQSIREDQPLMLDETVNFIAPFRSLSVRNQAFYLPASEKEFKKVADVLKVNVIDPNCTKSDIISLFQDNNIIHLATHAFSEASTPAGYYLCINQDPEAFDGRLYLHEIYGSPFDAGLLILNACQTAKTHSAALSLSRAFYLSGTRHIISTQWKIADETSLDITDGFYQEMATSDHLGACLGEVKRNYLQTHVGIRLHPYYWDGHQAWGSGSVKLVSSIGLRGRPWLWSLGIFLLVALGYYKKKRVVQ